MTRAELLKHLQGYAPMAVAAQGMRCSAVLLPFRSRRTLHDGLELVLTRRAQDLDVHAGQVAFPGGGMEPEDDGPEATALRETYEELGVPPDAVEVVGRLDEMLTITGYHVTPVVGLLRDDVALTPDPAEVARVFAVPLERLLDPRGWQQQEHSYRGSRLLVWHFPYDGEDVWGVTGTILRRLIEHLWEQREVG